MKRLRVVAVAVVAGAVVAGAAVSPSLWDDADGKPVRDRLPVAPLVVRKNVWLDSQGTVVEELPDRCEDSRYPYFCQRVRTEVGAHDERLLAGGGLTIRTTLDQAMQEASQRAVDDHVHRDDPQVAGQAMVVPGSGEIRAMATSRGTGDPSGLQQGSTAMAYTLAAAFENGMRSEDGFAVSGEYRTPGFAAFRNCQDVKVGDPTHRVVDPRRADRFHTLRSGTRETVPTFFMKLEERVGLCETVRMARRLGLGRADGHPLAEYATFTLGVNEVEPVSVAISYATLAARGRHCAPMAVTEIRDGSGAARSFVPRCRQVLDPAVADAVTGVLADAAGDAVKGLGRDAAGLPGTVDAHAAAWYAGYTPALASAVGVGDPRGGFRHPLTDVTIGGRRYSSVPGSSIPAHIWTDSMTTAVRGTEETAFVKPDAGRFGGCREACAK
ncbi:hypothetical protein [Nonomuraea cavernae]|uniref:Penicillin-binding protein n=1 Tax=Nonomuraea cavernae TaxID=2045107 RepID=A0A918DHR7_9ACTN|nr:hypothetical protein [Nonomuraea cavernae]MCA2190835.1 hypothetical protein [Nonomuraea cavernae]GGO66931.1 hypothetical protein GCM10012289_22180 [Nonomuraea cavernae]